MINIISGEGVPEGFRGKSKEWWIDNILNDLFFLCKIVLRHDKTIEYRDLNWVHQELCDFLDPKRNPIPQLLVIMARDMLKSSIGRAVMIQWFLQQAYDKKQAEAFIFSGVFELAQDHLEKIINEILRNQLIQAFFQEWIPNKKEQFDTCRLDEGKIRYNNIGIDVGSTEKTLTGRHYSLGIVDNLCNEINTQTFEMRKKTNKRWQQLESVFVEGAREIIFETPWAIDDVSGIILHPEGKFDYKKLWRNPCYRFISDTGYAVFSCPAARGPGEIGEPVFPKKIDKEYLDRKRRKQGRYIYSCLYELIPIPDEDVIIRPEWWQVYYETPPMPFVRNICVDAAGGTEKSKSFSGVTIGEWDSAGTLYIPYASKRDISPGKVADWIIELYDMSLAEDRPVTRVGIELEKYGISIKETIKVDRKREDIWEITDLWPTRGWSRSKRQEQLVPYFERRKIILRRGLQDFEDELKSFYRGKNINVDILDSLWGQLQYEILPKPSKFMTPQETAHAQAEKESEDFERQSSRDRDTYFRERRGIASRF